MDMNVYQQKATETAIYATEYPIPPQLANLFYVALGLAGEAGEVANKVKKIIRDDDGFLSLERRESILHELGDVLWYVSQVAAELDASLAELAIMNLKKLSFRHSLGGSGDTR